MKPTLPLKRVEPCEWYSSRDLGLQTENHWITLRPAHNGTLHLGISVLNSGVRHGKIQLDELSPSARYANPIQFAQRVEVSPQSLSDLTAEGLTLVQLIEREGERDFGIPVENIHLFSFNQVGHSNLSELKIKEIVERYRVSGRHSDYQEAAYEKCEGIIRQKARKWDRRTPSNIEYDELLSAGFVGLIKAMDRFPLRDTRPFEPYASRVIENSIIDALRDTDVVSQRTREKAREVDEYASRFRTEYSREPSPEEARAALSLDPGEIAEIFHLVDGDYMRHLDRQPNNGTPLIGRLPDLKAGRGEKARDSSEVLRRAVALLPPEDQRFIVLRYFKGQTVDELKRHYGYANKGAVSQRNSVILERLRRVLAPLS